MLDMPKALAILTLLLALTGAANVMTVYRVVDLDLNDELRITYSGTSNVYVLTSTLPQEAFITVVQGSGYGGAIYLKVNRVIRGTYDYIVALYSASPYTVNVTVIRGGKYITESLNCPANITLQMYLRLVVNSTYPTAVPVIALIPMYLRPTTWSIVAILAIPSLFITSALLDIRDYSRIKRDRWGIQEGVALVMRYMLYGSFVTFAVTLLVTLVLTIYSQLVYGVLIFDPSPVITSFVVLVVSATGYAVCRWRGWYDVIDEE